MALVIEDGSLVAAAVSYVTAAEARAFAVARGSSLPVGDPECEALIIKAMDYLETQEESFQGERVDASQALSWPRQGVWLYGAEFAEDAIPKALKDTLCQLTLDAQATDLMPTDSGREIIREKVDVIETQYAAKGGPVTPVFTKAMNLLRPLLRAASGGLTVAVTRV